MIPLGRESATIDILYVYVCICGYMSCMMYNIDIYMLDRFRYRFRCRIARRDRGVVWCDAGMWGCEFC